MDFGPPLFFWVMLTAMVAAFVFAILGALRRHATVAVAGLLLGALIGIVIVYFAQTGAFCVAPPGSACA